MGTATVAVFTTQELYNQDIAVEANINSYLADAFAETSHSHQTVATGTHPNPPTEEIFQPITDTVCGNLEKDYQGLLDWWYDYHRCNNLPEAADANLLVTNSTSLGGEGNIGGQMSVAAGAQIANLPCCSTVETADSQPRYDAMQTSIHEIGHNLGLVHPDGYHSVSGDDYYQSFMMHDYSDPLGGGNNNCGKHLQSITNSMNQHNDFSWSSCAESNMSL